MDRGAVNRRSGLPARSGSLSKTIPSKPQRPCDRGHPRPPPLPEAVAESSNFARTMAQAPRPRGPGSLSVAGCGSTVVAPCNCLRPYLRPGLGPGFALMVCSPSVGVRCRHGCLLVPMARIPKRLRFYEDAANVVQRRLVSNFKKSFERAVRTARR